MRRIQGPLYLCLFVVGVLLLVLVVREQNQSAKALPLTIRLVPVASGLQHPVGIAHSGMPDDQRLFILEQAGTIRIVQPDGTVLPRPFLNITESVTTVNWEQGLLGVAFHPRYADNGYFYLHYSDKGGDSHISRFQVHPERPDEGDETREQVLLRLDKPEADHNGGALHFGPDGYLYSAVGDGGSHHASFNAQDRGSLFGKLLRLDVDSGTPYAIPPDNPFVDDPTARAEIWSLGLRNPWRFSFDRQTGDLYLGDVGVDGWEEINQQRASSRGGINYGWPCYEGDIPFFFGGCDPLLPYQPPFYQYAHAGNCSAVIGGYVYRGEQFPELHGYYLFADLCSSTVYALPVDTQGNTNILSVKLPSNRWTSFGEDGQGELYIVSYEGTLYQIQMP